MLFENINFLLEERGAPALSSSKFLSLNPNELYEIIAQLEAPFETLNTVDLRKRKQILQNKEIKLLVLDVDGVFTDGGLYYTSSNEEIKKFNVKDGMAITQGIKKGLQIGIISAASRSEVVEHRARILGIQNVYVGKEPKLKVLESWLYKMGFSFDDVGYIGDDINDIAILEKVGVGACPSDAVAQVKEKAAYVLQNSGGNGCIREYIELFTSN